MCPFILFAETAQDSVHSLLLKYHITLYNAFH